MTPRQGTPVTLVDPPYRRLSSWATMIVVVALTTLVGIGAWLFSPSELGELQPPPNLASFAYADGVLSKVEMPTLVLDSYEPVDGQSRVTLRVRDADLRYFDVVHLRAHSSIGLPTRVYYENDGTRLWAVYKEDAPVNSAGAE